MTHGVKARLERGLDSDTLSLFPFYLTYKLKASWPWILILDLFGSATWHLSTISRLILRRSGIGRQPCTTTQRTSRQGPGEPRQTQSPAIVLHSACLAGFLHWVTNRYRCLLDQRTCRKNEQGIAGWERRWRTDFIRVAREDMELGIPKMKRAIQRPWF